MQKDHLQTICAKAFHHRGGKIMYRNVRMGYGPPFGDTVHLYAQCHHRIKVMYSVWYEDDSFDIKMFHFKLAQWLTCLTVQSTSIQRFRDLLMSALNF